MLLGVASRKHANIGKAIALATSRCRLLAIGVLVRYLALAANSYLDGNTMPSSSVWMNLMENGASGMWLEVRDLTRMDDELNSPAQAKA